MQKTFTSFFILLGFLFATSFSHADGEVSLSLAFKTKVATYNNETLRLIAKDLQARTNYLENRYAIHELFTNGVSPTTQRSEIEAQKIRLQNIQQRLNTAAQKIPTCWEYFRLDNSAYDLLLKNVDVVLSLPNEQLGYHINVGNYWKNEIVPQATTSNTQIIRSLVYIEFLYRALNQYNSLFLQKLENSSSLLQVENAQCTQGQERVQLEALVAERIYALNALQILLLGQRGVWDVHALSNLLVPSARDEFQALKNRMYATSFLMAVAIALPLASPLLVAALPASAGVMQTLNLINYTSALFMAAHTGYSFWSYSDKFREEIITPDIRSQVLEMLHSAMALPDSNFELYKMVEQYEVQLHVATIRLSPERNAQNWLPDALAAHGSEEALAQVYRAQAEYVLEELAARRVQP